MKYTLIIAGGIAACLCAGPVARAQSTEGKPAEDTIVLNPFLVQTKADEGYISSSATAVGRISQQLENIPQQVDIINSAFIKELQPSSFQDILNYDSGVDYSNSQFNGSSPLVRGFSTPIPLRNGVEMGLNGPSQFGNYLGLEAIEQVEIVKGAAAVLYGPSQPGGVVNYVTKSPQFTQSGSADVTLFNRGGSRASLDLTGPLPLKDSTGRSELAYRLVLTDEGRELYQINNQSLQRQVLYGAVTYQPFRDLTIDANYEYDHEKVGFFNSLVMPQATINALANGSLSPSQAPVPYSLFPVSWTFNDTGTFLDEHDEYGQLDAVFHHDFGAFGNWTFRVNYILSQTALFRQLDDIAAGYFPQAVTAANIGQTVNYTQTVTAADVAAGRLWVPARYARQINTPPIASLDTQWDLTGLVTTGPIKHTVLVGSSQNLGVDYRSGIAGVDQVERDAFTGAAGTVNAIWVNSPDLRPMSNIDWNGPLVTSISKSATGVQYNNSIKFGIPWFTLPRGGNYDKDLYAFDAASLLDDKLQISGGIRYDDVSQAVNGNQYTESRSTFRAGVVCKLLPSLQLYALHSESFLPNAAAISAAFGYFVSPQTGLQNEVGIRMPLMDKRVDIEASFYKITSNNIVQTNPFNNGTPASMYVFVPGVTNKGVDLTARINLLGGTQLIATASHYDLVQQGGPAQIAAGTPTFPVTDVPSNQAGVWLRYVPQLDSLKDFAADIGYRYVGRRGGGGIGSPPAFYLNGYGIVDLGLSYTRGRWSVRANAHNLFDVYAIQEATATSRLYPVEPLQETVAVSVKF